jgi:hypothetical protein
MIEGARPGEHCAHRDVLTGACSPGRARRTFSPECVHRVCLVGCRGDGLQRHARAVRGPRWFPSVEGLQPARRPGELLLDRRLPTRVLASLHWLRHIGCHRWCFDVTAGDVGAGFSVGTGDVVLELGTFDSPLTATADLDSWQLPEAMSPWVVLCLVFSSSATCCRVRKRICLDCPHPGVGLSCAQHSSHHTLRP